MNYGTANPRGFAGDPKRGAALGRPDKIGTQSYCGVLMLRRVRIDANGYDGLGTYWGIGEPLWWFASADGHIDRTTRAMSREKAREFVRYHYPNAKVHR